MAAAAHEDLQGRIQQMALGLSKEGDRVRKVTGVGTVIVTRHGVTTATSPTLTDAVNKLDSGEGMASFVLNGILYNVGLA